MIISDRHSYLFVQFPRTACTAVGRELIELYDGEPILHKHATYQEFLLGSGRTKSDYFVFSSIRNPFDSLVSLYFKLKHNSHGHFTNPNSFQKNGGHVTERMRRHYRYVQHHTCGFEDYLKKFHKVPYVDWSVLDHKQFDFIIRYESLQEDFATALSILGIEQMRPLPVVNKTDQVSRDKETLFPSGSTRHAVRVIGPMMEYWGYAFPFDIEPGEPRRYDRALFSLAKTVKSMYWRNRARHPRGWRSVERHPSVSPNR